MTSKDEIIFKLSNEEKESSVELFKAYIRHKTISYEGPDSGSYGECVDFLKSTCSEYLKDCEMKVVEYVKNKPILIVKVAGKDDKLEGILLNSHYDVVPVMKDHWIVDAFEGKEIDGKIYGRGTQDMKSVGVQYILALSKLIKKTGQLERTVFLTFVPDEEVGGVDGMGKLVESDYFKTELKPKIGIAFDEGLANPKNKYTVFYGERTPCWITIKATGNTGHGSRFIENLAVEKILSVANKAMKLREEQRQDLINSGGCSHSIAKKLGDVLTLNLTVLQAGVQTNGKFSYNVIPDKAMAGFDMRVPVTMPMKDVHKTLDDWCKEEGLSWEFVHDPGNEHYVSHHDLDDPKTSPFWLCFNQTCQKMNIDIEAEIFPAGTDSRFLRASGIQAFGFSPMKNSAILLHMDNEYLDKEVFLEGIEVFCNLFNDMANMKASDVQTLIEGAKNRADNKVVAKGVEVKKEVEEKKESSWYSKWLPSALLGAGLFGKSHRHRKSAKLGTL